MDKGFKESMWRQWTVQDMSCRLNDGLFLESWSVWGVCVVLNIAERVGLCHCGLRSSVVSGVHSCCPDAVSTPVTPLQLWLPVSFVVQIHNASLHDLLPTELLQVLP